MTNDSSDINQGIKSEILDIPAAISVSDLADLMDVNPVEVVKGLMRGGYMFAVNDVIEHDIASVVVQIFGFKAKSPTQNDKTLTSLSVSTEGEDPKDVITRPPIVTILGHVDHGKTTLLDTIRKTNVVDGEAGGITQHIAAYQIKHDAQTITFLDTPGHEAFTAMRARGAQVTDIAILVIAADDGIMPQTLEAIDHVRAANVPMIIAITKIDVPNANVDDVYRQLSEQNILVEAWGGDVISIPLSGITGEGIPELLENILLVSEISELKANPKGKVRGVVIESKLDKSRGVITTALIQTGTIRQGDILVTGETYGKIRAMFDDKGEKIITAGPSKPIEIMGINDVPISGSIVEIVESDKEAKSIISAKSNKLSREGITLQDAHSRNIANNVRHIDLIIKTDVQGSIEAVKTVLDDLNSDTTRVNIIRIASGGITERDIMLAVASKAVIIGFNTLPEGGAKTLAKQEGIEIRNYTIIYKLVEDIQNALDGLLETEYQEVYVGRATIRAIFNVGRHTKVAGIYVNDGKATRDSQVHIIRSGEKVFEGSITTLKHFKNDVKEVTNGFEGGLTVEGFNEFEENDELEFYGLEEIT
ncbi:MAG: translation initiation factor IF-2 [SAR202 cluster bacterium]|nr:translation initiation factor IF-2 [Chloroflexota bacterium]MQG22154.1 translation initiation factor IF-2 [SAR202 cluster bacterium]|tara:strand:+ start:8227 stop:9999 length:1773 start_codon:yes stop_codon:yes gene_type:complete